ncbi:hypothetical protein DEO72_LG8g2165 [Vigna unguiculata]|uniref:Uncharacterized protein n=1 Tax=Vigna unguiculata TaxID=3917 RepID=A0A4D6MU56_VIGUN|nr:hypothetical protein DEO72_LG8g2165 [Vigna unguiculata]
MSSTSDSMSLTTSSSGSGRSREGIGKQSDEESGNHVVGVGRISMEMVTKVREDLPEEIAERHMAQLGKKNLTLFQTLRKEKVARARAVWSTEVPNLQESLVEVHVHGGTKRKVELSAKPDRGKDVKKVRATLSTGGKGPEACLI